VGEDEIIAQIKEGIVEFERCICHPDSLPKMNKAGLGRILGPKGLMPSTKLGTVVTNVGATVKNMVGASEYRERDGVVRMAIGQLKFTPEELQKNIKMFMETLKKDIAQLSDRINKEVHEVVCEPLYSIHSNYELTLSRFLARRTRPLSRSMANTGARIRYPSRNCPAHCKTLIHVDCIR
jgi:hypothetical protein